MARVVMVGPVTAARGKKAESGVAQYLAELLESTSGQHEVRLLAQMDSDAATVGHVTVQPTWTPTMAAPWQLLAAMRDFAPDLVHLQHEFNLYGGQIPTAAVTAALGARRALAKPLVVTVHGVVDPADVTPEFLDHNYLPHHVKAVKAAFHVSYRFLGRVSTRIIVHHDHFKDLLTRAYGVPACRVTVVPLGHGASDPRSVRTRRALNVLVLGFLTGYKEPEAVVRLAASDLLPGAHFRFCVGKNPRIVAPGYEERYRRLEASVSALAPRASMRGFVHDDDLPDVLRSADVLVLPYSQCLAATAVAGLAIRYGVPFCHSRQLAPILGDGPGVFDLADSNSLATAIEAVVEGSSGPVTELFAPWGEVAARTEAVWSSV